MSVASHLLFDVSLNLKNICPFLLIHSPSVPHVQYLYILSCCSRSAMRLSGLSQRHSRWFPECANIFAVISGSAIAEKVSR